MLASPSDLFAQLSELGLNVHGVLPLADWPDFSTDEDHAATHGLADSVLWVIGHQGPRLWQHLSAWWGEDWPSRRLDAHPIDAWSRETIERALQARGIAHRCLFPLREQQALLPLQQWGRVLGWHQHSPFQVGIDAEWGSWFAYRAVFVVRQPWPITPQRVGPHPCETCTERACLSACPANALRPQWDLQRCLRHRLAPASSCANTCLARCACPVGQQHAYDESQMAYHYGQSLAFMRRWATSGGES